MLMLHPKNVKRMITQTFNANTTRQCLKKRWFTYGWYQNSMSDRHRHTLTIREPVCFFMRNRVCIHLHLTVFKKYIFHPFKPFRHSPSSVFAPSSLLSREPLQPLRTRVNTQSKINTHTLIYKHTHKWRGWEDDRKWEERRTCLLKESRGICWKVLHRWSLTCLNIIKQSKLHLDIW